MNRLNMVGLVLISFISTAIHPMAESLEQKLVDREMRYESYLTSVENGLYGDDYSNMVHTLKTTDHRYDQLIESVDHLVNCYRNDMPVLVRSLGRELRMNSFADLQDRIKEAIRYKYGLIRAR